MSVNIIPHSHYQLRDLDEQALGAEVCMQLLIKSYTTKDWEKSVEPFLAGVEVRGFETQAFCSANEAAKTVVLFLAAEDADRCQLRNKRGFGKFDKDVGHRIADMVTSGAALPLWAIERVQKFAVTYHKQLDRAMGKVSVAGEILRGLPQTWR